jgi:two-component system, OmpR family, response regulator
VPEKLHKTVLVVDDDAEIRDVITRFLRRHGYETIQAAGGQSALDVIANRTVNLVILDVMMPGLDGFATLNTMRAMGNSVPVMFLTARSVDDDVIHGYTTGADLYLVKPVAMGTLRKAVEYLIGDLTAEEKAVLEQEI